MTWPFRVSVPVATAPKTYVFFPPPLGTTIQVPEVKVPLKTEAPAVSVMLPPAPKVPLTFVLNEGKVRVALPQGLNGVTDPHEGVQKLMPLTPALTDAEFGVRLIVPPFRLKSMLSASAAAGTVSRPLFPNDSTGAPLLASTAYRTVCPCA